MSKKLEQAGTTLFAACSASQRDQFYGRIDRLHLLVHAPKTQYPKQASKMNIAGTATVTFNIDRAGNLARKVYVSKKTLITGLKNSPSMQRRNICICLN